MVSSGNELDVPGVGSVSTGGGGACRVGRRGREPDHDVGGDKRGSVVVSAMVDDEGVR